MSRTGSFDFHVKGDPVPKGRPRVVQQGGRHNAFTPAVTVKAQHHVAGAYRRAAGWHVVDAAARFVLRCEFHIPDGRRVDVDNLGKLVMDALIGLAWKDDSQVDVLIARKILKSPTPGTWVRIEQTLENQ